ncbi:MAG: hypothetical protein KA473_08025 [Anaerolineales bacterium]|nr:hypothetical protein [Anaerolineales bacterium]MBP6209375.1 hypothetical protein [Anaerolineales bacterium]
MNYSWKRIGLSFLLGLVLAAITTEGSYFLLKKENREPTTIELEIPAGTSELVKEGKSPPEIPMDMRFVVGDTLKVVNLDSENHQLGPLWIPAGSSASLKLETAENLMYECTFQTGSYLGINIQEPVTWRTRVSGIFYAGFPMGMMFAVYSGLIGDQKKKVSK